MSDDEDAARMEAALRQKWFGRGARIEAPSGSAPLSSVIARRTIIEIATRRVWASSAYDVETTIYSRILGGSRVEIMRTRNQAEAKAEADRWRAAGAVVEPYRESR